MRLGFVCFGSLTYKKTTSPRLENGACSLGRHAGNLSGGTRLTPPEDRVGVAVHLAGEDGDLDPVAWF